MAVAQAPDALRLRPHGLGFDELKDLSEAVERIQEDADASLAYFRHDESGGFAHRVDPAVGPEQSSKASTATCLAYLRAAGKLTDEGWGPASRHALRGFMIDGKWESAGLPEDNPFTSAFLLEAIDALGAREGLETERVTKVNQKIEMVAQALIEAEGGLSIQSYPPTAFLTHKVVRVLDQWNALADEARENASTWSWGHLYEESMLIASDSPDADFFELAYAALTASLTSQLDRMTPRERRLLQHALEQFFDGQRPDGTWPRSRPLFLYPGIGYAYCYDYELLVQLLSERQLRSFVFPHLGELRNAMWALDARRVPREAEERAVGWSSEHHGKDFEAESWPTASVFHFCFELGRLVSDAIRREVFEYVDAPYEEPKLEPSGAARLSSLMDSTVEHDGDESSLKTLINEQFLEPLLRERDFVRDGRSFGPKTKISAIVYGAPGTSKTRLVGMIAQALGWPLLALDPSHLTRRGLDNIHAEADALFTRLRHCDQMVVLLDEFDELVREREVAGELQSRFLTTAMLPKIAALHARRRLVYIVATNHLEQFDAAISRPGRFDVIVPVNPPTTEEKCAKWPALERTRTVLLGATPPYEEVVSAIGDLTYAEAEALAERIDGVDEVDALRGAVNKARQGATVNQPVDPGDTSADAGADAQRHGGTETWRDRIRHQKSKIRGLGP